ncbi:DUF222 domain-containing protein [Microbacterium sp. P07]|uniref:HNH endonuclease signature motif containing protein n=1 Tax=Microbacterium sp. P07 TaxID=3366952 RepID=UPI003744C386
MEHHIARLRDLASQARDTAAEVFAAGAMRSASEGEIVAMMDAVAAALRPLDALLVEATGEVDARSDSPRPGERMTARYGCRNSRELIERVTRISGRRAGEYLAAGTSVHEPIAPTSGAVLPPQFPALRAALAEGAIGVDAVVAVSSVLGSALPIDAAREAADTELAASARGDGVDGAPPASADELRLQAQVWAMVLDPDGAEPRDTRAARKRGLTFGQCRDGLVAVRGQLLAEVAAQWQRLNDSILNPRLVGPRFVEEGSVESEADIEAGADRRTTPQKRHDALATILTVAARSGEMPTIGGAAPTLVVSALAEDVTEGTGFAHIDGVDEPLSIRVARQIACTGGVQRVTHDARGRVVSIDVSDRVFNAYQRRAIGLRDGTCIIPGCRVPAIWCEIHHVTEAARGGPTHTDNGVLLCWHHHRTIDTSGWQIRMNDGVPEVRAPQWREPFLQWRPVTTSPTMRRRRVAARGQR